MLAGPVRVVEGLATSMAFRALSSPYNMPIYPGAQWITCIPGILLKKMG
jgi:hypothetical protein